MSESVYTLSKLQMYEECPQKYKMCYIDKVHVVENIHNDESQKGNRLHSLINFYLKGSEVKKLVETLSAQEKLLWHNFITSEIKNYKFTASEYSFNLKLDNHWLTGRIDALFEYDKDFIILDWKTGDKFRPENVKFQTAFYLLCVYEILKSKKMIKSPEQLSLHYFSLTQNNIIKIRFSEELYSQYKSKILTVINKILESKTFFCNKTEKCKYCKYYKNCPYL